MSREIDERKKRKALRKLRKAALLAEQGLGPSLSDWETQFLEEVEERIETYGSAFHDPEKGAADEPLSALQSVKLKEIEKKARGKGKSGFKSKKTSKKTFKSNTRQLDDDVEMPSISQRAAANLPKGLPKLVPASDLKPDVQKQTHTDSPRRTERPKLRLIKGGVGDDDI